MIAKVSKNYTHKNNTESAEILNSSKKKEGLLRQTK